MKLSYFYKLTFIILFLLFFHNIPIYSAINNKIIAKIGNEIITSYELENKIRTILFFSKKELNQNNINQIKQKALKELIDKKLKKNEVEKYMIEIENSKVENYLENFSAKFKLNNDKLKKLMIQNNVDYDLHYEDIKINLSWQSLIISLNSNRLEVNENQIVKELNDIINEKKNLLEYEIAEIAIDQFESSQELTNKINEIKKYIKEFSFSDAAIKYSNSSSSLQGGNIGWINSNLLSDAYKRKLDEINTGEIIEIKSESNQITLIKLLNKRKVLNNDVLDIEKVKQKLIEKRKNELLNIYANNHLSKKRNNTVIKFFNE